MQNKEKEMLERLREIVKTSKEDCMLLPWGNSEPEEVITWLVSLSNEEFDALMHTPIVIQAKIYYTQLRKEFRK